MFLANAAELQHWQTSVIGSAMVTEQEEGTASPASSPVVGPLGCKVSFIF